MGKWPQRRSRQLRRFRRSEPPIIADFFLPSTPHFEVVDAASFEPEGFLRSEPAILAGFSSSSTPREEEVAAAALQSAVASFPCSEPPIIAGFFVSSTPCDVADSPRSLLRCFEKRRRLERGRAVYRDHAEVQALFDTDMTSTCIHADTARDCALSPRPARMHAR